jgi:steroid delta-isomerase-like uncharacterized protein
LFAVFGFPRRATISKEAVTVSKIDNKAIARRFAQAWAAGGLSIVDELASPDLVVSYPLPPEPIRGPEAFKAFLTEFIAGLPDATITVDDMIAEDDKVACRWTMRGTHEGPLFGFPPTLNQVDISGFTFYRIVGGKVVEEAGIGDALNLLQQLGAVIAPGTGDSRPPGSEFAR